MASLLVIPLLSLVAIWGYAATVTVSEGLELVRFRSLYESLVIPTTAVTEALQVERHESSVFLGVGRPARPVLDQRRTTTDQALTTLRRSTSNPDVREDMTASERLRLGELLSRSERLADIRVRVDTGTFSRRQTLEAYNGIMEAGIRVFDSVKVDGGLDLLEQTNASQIMTRARELLSRQGALIGGALASRGFTGEELTTFRGLVENRRMLYDMAFNRFDADLRAPYYTLQNSPDYLRYEAIEDLITTSVRAERELPVDAGTWDNTTEAVLDGFARINVETNTTLSARAEPLVVGILVRIAAAGGLGLIAVAASVFLMVRFARSTGTELGRLQATALELAHQRLPKVVERLRRGETVDVAEEAPEIHGGTTREIANVEAAFASVQRTAVEAAVGQAEIRKGINQVFLNLARRSQSLLHRQLTMLEGMERRATDPEILEDLFGLDHLTTRMRRHAEGLIIMSGAAPGRGWRHPVSIFDVVRAAVEEVEDYLRVQVDIHSTPALLGNSVTDVIHLVAELVENATIFSPPHTKVHVRGEVVARGYALEIEDRGLGMTEEEYAAVNERLIHPPEFDLADSDRLGLFVVGRLADRHGIRISLRPSPYGGTTAIVLIPAQLVVQVPELPNATPSPRQQPTFSVERIPVAEAPVPSRRNTTFSVERVPSSDGDELPKRVRQANMAPQLRNPAPAPVPADVDDEATGSSNLLTSFKAGWNRAEQENQA